MTACDVSTCVSFCCCWDTVLFSIVHILQGLWLRFIKNNRKNTNKYFKYKSVNLNYLCLSEWVIEVGVGHSYVSGKYEKVQSNTSRKALKIFGWTITIFELNKSRLLLLLFQQETDHWSYFKSGQPPILPPQYWLLFVQTLWAGFFAGIKTRRLKLNTKLIFDQTKLQWSRWLIILVTMTGQEENDQQMCCPNIRDILLCSSY